LAQIANVCVPNIKARMCRFDLFQLDVCPWKSFCDKGIRMDIFIMNWYWGNLPN
jgi:hypothetical protein